MHNLLIVVDLQKNMALLNILLSVIIFVEFQVVIGNKNEILASSALIFLFVYLLNFKHMILAKQLRKSMIDEGKQIANENHHVLQTRRKRQIPGTMGSHKNNET